MKKILFLVLTVIIALPLFSQKKNMRVNKAFGRTHAESGLTLSSNGSSTMFSPSLIQYWSFGEVNRKFKFGIGGRLNSVFGGGDLEYITAAARLTSGKVGPGVFFADQIPENIDTVAIGQTQLNALNIYLALRYDFLPQLGLEFNIDLAGITLGAEQDVVLSYDDDKKYVSTADPTTGNLLLISDNDIGTLNSELMLSYTHAKRFKFKVGAVFLFNEYTIRNPIVYTNANDKLIDAKRYRNKTLQFGVGVNYAFNYFKSQNFK